jgi:hypothetical protein
MLSIPQAFIRHADGQQIVAANPKIVRSRQPAYLTFVPHESRVVGVIPTPAPNHGR